MNLRNPFGNPVVNIDLEGYPKFGDLRVEEPEVGAEILRNIQFSKNGAMETSLENQKYVVEAFDEPLVAQMIDFKNSQWIALLPYDVNVFFDLHTLSVDEWDRFHGLTNQGIPFVMSNKAQAHFFNLVDEFDDESITWNGTQFEIPPYYGARPELGKEQYWTQIYQTENPGWELNQAAPALVEFVPKLKLPKSRVLVLGCGSGNDAALFAQAGHIVTAIDISEEAIQRAKTKYENLKNIKWIQADVFHLDSTYNQAFDIVVEHTCYCAIDPSRRNELIKIWNRVLVHGGFLMGIFFVMERRNGPPFGGTEWELRERLKKYFQFSYWNRYRNSIQNRNGKELFVYANKFSENN
jgi:SAM-dependent methyltransferase